MTFDPTINFGQVIVAVSFAVSIIFAFASMKSKIDLLSKAIDTFNDRLEEHDKTLIGLMREVSMLIGKDAVERRRILRS